MALCNSADGDERSRYSHPWLAEFVFALDRRLRRGQGVLEYSRDPCCMFRLEICCSNRNLTLRDGTELRARARIARLHYWNEHVPLAQASGMTIGWGREFHRRIALSLGELARYLSSRPELRDIEVICGDVASGVREQSGKIAWIMTRYGFETFLESEHLPFGDRVHRFGENVMISLMVLARNASAFRLDSFRRVRVPIYLSRQALEHRFGAPSAPAAAVVGRR